VIVSEKLQRKSQIPIDDTPIINYITNTNNEQRGTNYDKEEKEQRNLYERNQGNRI